MRGLRQVAAAIALLTVAACGDDSLFGEWESVQDDQVMRLTLNEDSTFVLDIVGSFTGEGTYSVDGLDLSLQPTGVLAASMPGGFTGSIADWRSIELCSPNGACSNFARVE